MPKSVKSGRTKKQEKLTKLVIVESPSKATTLKKYLGSSYTVKASAGHVIDLPKSTLGIDTETFEPRYIVMRDRSQVMKDLMQSVKLSSEIFLASDPDREGEAIACHLKSYFQEKALSKIQRNIPIRRIRFSEITKNAVLEALKNPTEITDSLVSAQKGRRIIDRLFGYELSPLLWKKIKGKLSAGRVQSTALKLVMERESEIDNFVTQEYWKIQAELLLGKAKYEATLNRVNEKLLVSPGEFANAEKQIILSSQKEVDQILKELATASFVLKDIKKTQSVTKASAPFITSTLQQAANNILGWGTAKTMKVAQELYEGIDLSEIRTGLITYMRTDSTRISVSAAEEAKSYILKNFGKAYLPKQSNVFSNKKNSQDAHEAIRPVQLNYAPLDVKNFLSADQYKLYNLIWSRFMASQMASLEREQILLMIIAGTYLFTISRSQVLFDGFQKIWNFGTNKKKEQMISVDIPIGTEFKKKNLVSEQKFTMPPPHYTEAALVKIMEELGVGRPSTYAPTIATLIKRYYVKKSGKSLLSTELGKAVNSLLKDHFAQFVNSEFTAKMEAQLDAVEESKISWKNVVKDFYKPFHQTVTDAFDKIDTIKGSFEELTDEICEKCQSPMVKKMGKYGYFLACSSWPECSNAQPISYGICPKCIQGKVIERKGGRRGTFFGCKRYPDCDFITNLRPSEKVCPKDGAILFFSSNKQNKLVCLRENCNHEEKFEE